MKPSSNFFCKNSTNSDRDTFFIIVFHSLKIGEAGKERLPACPYAYYIVMDFDLSIKLSVYCSSIIMTFCFIYLFFDLFYEYFDRISFHTLINRDRTIVCNCTECCQITACDINIGARTNSKHTRSIAGRTVRQSTCTDV